MTSELKIDEIGYWSEIKLAILEEYAKPYNQILVSNNLHPVYIDGFAGAGHHIAKGSERLIEGSPTRALGIQPPFEAFHFVDLDDQRVAQLRKLSAARTNVHVHHGNCNNVLVNDIFPKINFSARQRALCILDPYGLHLDWETIEVAGKSGIIEIFLNFPVMDMNRNVFWHDYQRVLPSHQERMSRFWGDDSWKHAAYETTQGLFGEMQQRTSNYDIAKAFQTRLKEKAGFQFVPTPMPMRNSRGAVVYYLFFAAQNKTANKIAKSIFAKYEKYGEVRNG